MLAPVYRIYNMDCAVGLMSIPDGSIDLIVTDPPYIVGWGGGGSINKAKKLDKSLEQLRIDNMVDGYDIESFSKEIVRLQGGNINAYFFCNKLQIPEYMRCYVSEMKCKFDLLCWHKRNALPTYSNKYLSDTEYCLFFHKGKGHTFPQSYDDAKTFEVGAINLSDKKLWGHPTIKPLGMIKKIVRNSSREGETVLDPFMGSGTTAIACLTQNRNFIGYEINQTYYETSMKRIEQVYNNQ